ncbi:Oidioi.mRNA.OKI2018_I69.chr2.g5608.t1.cds [Oikopleura dioica]|uniref:Oidioi.mRNA.OKI2018_I69.chr2.g5608.t1.cds n=1 Tax=Oikopleura dioica TaxID=34765 RepID=A0ABN7T7E8_OIKDI|nr:Oidioi.mRNA.OKI2018_I69.chr2.g5608.t1.cds [Oikopleura dioica]
MMELELMKTSLPHACMNAELPSEKSMITNDDIVEVVDSGISESDKTLEFDETLNNAIIRPNLDSIRRILGADGTEQARKVVEENTGLIPKFYKPYKLLEQTESGKTVSLYKCNFCEQVYRGHNSIVYHCRRHIGDYPYRCDDCGFVEVCKSGLSSHMNRTGHKNCRKIDATPVPGQNAAQVSTQITSKARPQAADLFNPLKSRNNKRSPSSMPDYVPSMSHSPKRSRVEQIDLPVPNPHQTANPWRPDVLESIRNFRKNFDADAFKSFQNNQKNFCMVGGKGFSTPKAESDEDSKFSDPKSTSEDSEIEEVEIIEEEEPAKHSQKPSESTKEWNFCQKCRAGCPSDWKEADFGIKQLYDANWIICNPTTPALILMTPKSLLRLPEARSEWSEMDPGTQYRRLIGEEGAASKNPDNVKRLIFCSGKVYYDLVKERAARGFENDIAIARVEQVAPFPYDLVIPELEKYKNAEVYWVQEKHKNMGFYDFCKPRLRTASNWSRRVHYAGRDSAASAAAGSKQVHKIEQDKFMNDAFRKGAKGRLYK